MINHHIIELISLALGSMTSLRELDGQSIARTAMLERIKQYIESISATRTYACIDGITPPYQRALPAYAVCIKRHHRLQVYPG